MEILIIFLLILLNGFFAMSEISIISARKTKLHSDAKKGNSGAKVALETANHPSNFLSTVQIGITLIGILTGIFSGEKITDNLQLYFEKYPLLKEYSGSISVAIVVICLTFFSLLFGELIPKRIGLMKPEKIAENVSIPMSYLSKVTYPFVWLLTKTSDFFIKLFGLKNSDDNKVTEEEIKAIIQQGTEGGEVEEIEQDIMGRVFNLGDRKVSSLMTHRNDITFLSTEDTYKQLKEKVEADMHTVYPVIKDDKDKVDGIVYLKDIVKSLFNNNLKITDISKIPYYMSENTSAYEALLKFKKTKLQSSLIVDEYGQIQGLLTLNDLLEALVGNVDEFHQDEYEFIPISKNSWEIDGQYPFHEFLMKFDIEDLEEDYSYNTISGLILDELKDIPNVDETIKWRNFDFNIIAMDGARIDKIKLTKH